MTRTTETRPSRALAARTAEPGSAYARGRDFVERCLAGDPDTRSRFVEEYGALIRFAMNSVLRQRGRRLEPEETDDLFQAIVVSFFDRDCRRLKLYEGRNEASFATFIRVCASRQTLDHLRHLRRRPTMVSLDDSSEDLRADLEEGQAPATGPEEMASASEQIERLRRLLLELPAREQLLVRLHFVDGLSIPEVARTIGISDNAAHVLKSRVRAKLRERMGEDVDG